MSPVGKVSRVLVGGDFDDASASALRMAGVLASTWDADVTVFHASTPDAPAYFTGDQIETLEAEREQSRAGTAAQVRAVAEEQVQRAVHVVVEEGPPGDALVRMAAEFDLISHCAPDLLENTDLIVLSMPVDNDTHFGAIVQVLKECVHPVLFVPSSDGIVERSTS
jgi:nucleotide-binding universal stress UspA family protein